MHRGANGAEGTGMSDPKEEMVMNDDKAREALSEIGMVAGRLVQRHGSNEDDAIIVATALMHAAETIFLYLGGPKLAEAQFLDAANRLAANTH
jgi:hypothetical protein